MKKKSLTKIIKDQFEVLYKQTATYILSILERKIVT